VARPGTVAPPIRIGIWGAGRSGKSTFLAALPLAALYGPRAQRWIVHGTTSEAANYLTEGLTQLVTDRRFPEPTLVTTPISWSFSGPPPHSGLFGLPDLFHRHGRDPVEFTVDLFDPPGRVFEAGQVQPEIVDILANASGILYLIDPLPGQKDLFTSFFATLQQVAARVRANRQMRRGKLPQFMAICITKFDDEELLRRLIAETNLVVQDKSGNWLPRIAPGREREYFDWVCQRMLGGAATVVRECLDTFFDDHRVRFFASSAIGFRLNSQQVFDFRDFRNVYVDEAGEPRIRDTPRPFNVLEPLVYLERHHRAAGGR
jgi:hypothetical protein